MFKMTKGGSGLRRSGSGGGGSARISGLHAGRGRAIEDEQRRRPAFMPATPQEQGFDSKNSRVSEISN